MKARDSTFRPCASGLRVCSSSRGSPDSCAAGSRSPAIPARAARSPLPIPPRRPVPMPELSYKSVQRLGLPHHRPDALHAQHKKWGDANIDDASERILIVEDDYLIAVEAEAALTEAGFVVVDVANSADEALAL